MVRLNGQARCRVCRGGEDAAVNQSAFIFTLSRSLAMQHRIATVGDAYETKDETGSFSRLIDCRLGRLLYDVIISEPDLKLITRDKGLPLNFHS